MQNHLLIGFLAIAFVLLGCPAGDDDDSAGVGDDDAADDDAVDDDAADDDAVDDDAADDDAADDDAADDDAADDDAADDDSAAGAADDDTGDDDTVSSTTVPGDYSTIQSAIDGSSDGDVVTVAAGTYTEALDFDGKAVHVLGIDGPAATILDANLGGSAVLFISGEGADSVLEGFTITSGIGTHTPGIDGEHLLCGGGAMIVGAAPTLRNLIITGNTADDGGGMYLVDGASPTLTDVTISYNTANDDGGGIFMWASAPTLDHVLVVGNVAYGEDGGGMAVKEGSAATLNNVVIVGNSAPDDGGGMRVKNSTADLTNVTIVANHAGDGGGMAVKNSVATLDNVVLAWNIAGSQGGGIYEKSGGTALLYYSNAWDNLPNNYDGSGGMVDPTGTNGNVSVDPGLLDVTDPDPANWDLHLSGLSPLIDTGDPFILDPDGSTSDLGAYGGAGAASRDLDMDGYFEWWLPGAYDATTSPGMDCDDRDAGVYPGSGC